MNYVIFDTYIETQFAPTLRADDVVIMDNLTAHKSPAAEAAIRAKGAWVLFLPPYSPILNPIEMTFSKLKKTFGPLLHERLMISRRPSVTSANSTQQKSAPTTSAQRDMDTINQPMLYIKTFKLNQKRW
jgi:DDE superfamily endonuclease